MVVSEMSS
jgi:meiosis induction protein kinase IME2/SME1